MWKFCKYFTVLAIFGLSSLCILVKADLRTEGFTKHRDAISQENSISQTSKFSNNSYKRSVFKNRSNGIADHFGKEMISDILSKTTREEEANAGVQKIINSKHISLEGQNVKQKATLWNTFYKTNESKKLSRTIRQLEHEKKDNNENINIESERNNSNEIIERETKISEEITLINSSKILAADITCQEDKENCRLFCQNGSVSFIEEIENCEKSETTAVAITKPNTDTTSRPLLTTSEKSSTISTTSSTTTNNVPSTTTSTNTISATSTTTQTSLIPPNLISIKCYLNEQNTESFWSHIVEPRTNFSLNINTSTSLTVSVQAYQKFTIIYFTNNYDYVYVDYPKRPNIPSNTEFNTNVYIKDLLPSKAYTFCVVTEPDLKLSPFDCQSLFMEFKDLRKTWLLQSDKVWFISIHSITAVFIFLLTIFIVYIILRFKSRSLEKRNIKILPGYNNSRKTLLSSRKPGYSSNRLYSSPSSKRSSNYLTSVQHLPRASDIIYTPQHAVPTFEAPNLPTSVNITRKTYNSPCLLEKGIVPSPKDGQQNMDHLNVIDYDPDYQTFDHNPTNY